MLLHKSQTLGAKGAVNHDVASKKGDRRNKAERREEKKIAKRENSLVRTERKKVGEGEGRKELRIILRDTCSLHINSLDRREIYDRQLTYLAFQGDFQRVCVSEKI